MAKDISDKNVEDKLASSEKSLESQSSGPAADEKTTPKSSSQSQNDWIYGIFKPTTKNGGGSGRPLGGGDGNNDRDKLLLLGAVGLAGFLGVLGLMDKSYDEIGWKEFVNR